MNQLLEKIKQGEHVFDLNADPEPEDEDCGDPGQDFDGDYEEGDGVAVEMVDGCAMSGSGKGR